MAGGGARRLRILIADDSAQVRAALRDVLAREGDLEVVGEAADGGGALRLAHELRPDVLVLDNSMPDGSGLSVLELLADTIPSIRVVLFTLETRLRSAALARGAAGFLAKDASADEIITTIRRAGASAAAGPSFGQRLGDYLVAHGLVAAAQRDAALAAQRMLAARGIRRRVGEILVEMGALAPSQLEEIVERVRLGIL